MNEITNENGAVFLNDTDGKLICIGSLQHGITFNLFKSAARKVCRVSICTSHFRDEFFFHEDRPVFHYVNSRDNLPALTRVYVNYFLEQETYSANSFLKYVVKHYFIKELGCQYSEPK